MRNVDEYIDRQCEHVRERAVRIAEERIKEDAEVLHSLPITTEDRDKREHEVEEQRRFQDMPGVFKITRNSDGYITEIRKQVEDIVFETVYTRDVDNYITGASSLLKKETKA